MTRKSGIGFTTSAFNRSTTHPSRATLLPAF